MLNLIKKNFLIIKKTWIIVMLIAVIIPAFLYVAGGGVRIPASISLTSMTIVLAVMLFSGLDEEEAKYRKAAAMLTTVGYSRNIQVINRYVLMYLIYFYCLCVYTVESLMFHKIVVATIYDIVISIFVFTLIASLYLVLTTKFGVKAGRYVVMAVILLISVGPTVLVIFDVKINFDFMRSVNEMALMLILGIFSLIMCMMSLIASIKIYSVKEL